MTVDVVVDLLKVLGGLLVLYELGRLTRHLYLEAREFSWKQIEQASDALFRQIAESGFVPDLIVGLGRGGTIAAGLLAAHFRDSAQYRHRMIPIGSVNRLYLVSKGKRRGILITGFHTIDVFDKNVLLLNADTYSGGTLDRAKTVLSWDRPREVRTGTLLALTENARRPDFDPDFCGVQLPDAHRKRRLPWRSKTYPLGDEHDLESIVGTLVVLHGHVAAGKTSVTDAIAKHLGFVPLYSDWYWFKYGVGDRARDRGVSRTHNKHMLGRCWSVLGNGADVVLDSTARWREFRDEIRSAFAPTRVVIIFVRCICTEATAMERIQRRRFIGPHDFGTAFEYERVKQDFDEMQDEEHRGCNLIDVNTDDLICDIRSVARGEAAGTMAGIVTAIEKYYFAKVRAERLQEPAASQKKDSLSASAE